MQDFIIRPKPRTAELKIVIPNSIKTPIYEEKVEKEIVQNKIPQLLTNAEILFKHNEKEMAFTLLREASGLNSQHPEVLKKFARYQKSKKQWDLVANTLEVLVKCDFCFENVALLADAYYQLGEDDKSIKRYDEALSLIVEDPSLLFDIYKNLGNIQVRQGDFQGAEENYFRAFSINNQSDILLVNLGTLEIQRQDYNAALEKFRQALSFNPQNDKAWVGLAMVHDKMGDFDLAMANIENAVEIEPGNRTAVHILSHWCVRECKYEVAIEALEEYLSTVQLDEEMSLVLIHLFCLNKQIDLAELEIERILLWNPQNETALTILNEIKKGRAWDQ